MTRSLRPSTPADAQLILSLFEETGLRPNVAPPEMQWKYWQPRADWSGPRSFVLTDEGGAIAHGAIIPGWCTFGSSRISVIHVIDWAGRPGAVGAGVAMMKYIGQQAQALLAIGGSAQTEQLLPHIGFRAIGAVTGYVRMLFPTRLFRGGATSARRLLPRFARSLAWTLAAPSARNAGMQVRQLSSNDIDRIAPVLPLPVRGMAVMQRGVAMLRYMLSCPIVPMALFSVEESGRTRGYFVLASAPGQVRIVDCWMDSDEPADWRGMLFCAVQQAKQDPQAAEVVIWANDPLLAAALTACGFHARREIPLWVRATDTTVMPPAPLRVQMLDNDAAFLHEGRAGYWA
jgi:hypothetical protein